VPSPFPITVEANQLHLGVMFDRKLMFRLMPRIGCGRGFLGCAAVSDTVEDAAMDWREIVTGHDAMVTAPAERAKMLLDIGAA
jgi:hypothetical protein